MSIHRRHHLDLALHRRQRSACRGHPSNRSFASSCSFHHSGSIGRPDKRVAPYSRTERPRYRPCHQVSHTRTPAEVCHCILEVARRCCLHCSGSLGEQSTSTGLPSAWASTVYESCGCASRTREASEELRSLCARVVSGHGTARRISLSMPASGERALEEDEHAPRVIVRRISAKKLCLFRNMITKDARRARTTMLPSP
jgi:hypothetical protein